VPRTTTAQRALVTGGIGCYLFRSPILVEAPLPDIAHQIENALARRALWVDADRCRLLQVPIARFGCFFVNVRVTRSVSLAPGVIVTFAPTRRTLPFFLGRQSDFVAQLRA